MIEVDPKWILWSKYEIVRRRGKYNMITEAHLAAKEAGLSKEEYISIIKEYGPIKNDIEFAFGSVEEFWDKYIHSA